MMAESIVLSSSALYFILFQILPHAVCGLQFNSAFNGNKLTGVLGSSLNFTWAFRGGNVDRIEWGTKRDSSVTIEDVLVSIDKLQTIATIQNPPYSGRVSGDWDGSSPGQASFTLNSIQKADERFYSCKLSPESLGAQSVYDTVQLIVVEAPQISIPSVPASCNEGSLVNISCTASGIPDPDVQWIRKVNVKSSGKKTVFLSFNSINRTDDGQYTCKANNSAGNDEKHVTLVVHYPPTIKAATTSTDNKSWIGQTVTLTCESDGVPTPTLTWYKPDGSQIKSVTATQNTVDVKISVVEDFGDYMCNADNGLATADFKIVKIQQIKKPGSPNITQLDIQATSLTVKWTAPVDDGGSPITAHRVVILKGSMEIKNVNITDPGTTSWTAGDLMRTTNYTVKVFSRNAVFEGPAAEKKARTKYEGVPAAATIDDLPNEVTDDTITLKWSEPQNNGRVITQYTVYQRIVTDGKPGEWIMLKAITSTSVRKLTVDLKKGKVYEFVVTAINEFGESLKEPGKFARVMASGVPSAVELNDIPSEVTDNEITLKWSAPENYGRQIEQYTVYKRMVIDGKPGEWIKLEIITDVSVRELTVKVEQGKEYEFVVTATNVHGESKIEDGNIKRVMVKGATIASKNKGSSCNETTLHIVYNIIIIVLLIIILVLIISLRRLRIASAISKRNRRNICVGCGGELVLLNTMATETTKRLSGVVPSGDSRTYAALSTGDYMALHPSTRSWEINREQVKVLKVIGKGAFSQVAKATTWNISGDEEYSTVAVKMLKANAPDSDRKDLLSELEVMKTLKPHPHVIELIGCVTDSDPLLVLIEYVPYGDLLGYLRKSRGLNDTYFKDPDVKPQTNLTAEQLMRFAWQVADGMFYLSSRKIIHRDLAARNVLVGEGEKCKVTDFGMARNVNQDDIYTKQSRGRLPVKWTAYEALLYGTYTTQSDVWSYGVLLYEILTVGGSPYPGIHARQIARKIQEGFRMPKPKHVDTRLYQIMLKCWEENPSDRPTFANLKDTLKEMERNHRTYVNLKQYDTTLYANVEDLTAE